MLPGKRNNKRKNSWCPLISNKIFSKGAPGLKLVLLKLKNFLIETIILTNKGKIGRVLIAGTQKKNKDGMYVTYFDCRENKKGGKNRS